MRFQLSDLRINRYIMECKYDLSVMSRVLLPELIDTLWNVNTKKNGNKKSFGTELIDTLWNVNNFFKSFLYVCSKN